jgi:hypothetical protein
MATSPKLVIKPFGNPSEYVCDLEEAKNYLNFDGGVILIEGRMIHSYEEFVQVASQDKYKNRETIEVALLPTITGG